MPFYVSLCIESAGFPCSIQMICCWYWCGLWLIFLHWFRWIWSLRPFLLCWNFGISKRTGCHIRGRQSHQSVYWFLHKSLPYCILYTHMWHMYIVYVNIYIYTVYIYIYTRNVFVLGSKLPLISMVGGWSWTPTVGVYIQYKDSLLKVGWPFHI